MSNQPLNTENTEANNTAKNAKKKITKENRISFKKAAIYLAKESIDVKALADCIENKCHRFTPAKSEQYRENSGFVPAYTVDGVSFENGELCHFIDSKAIVLKFRRDCKSVPKATLDEAFEKRMAELAETGDVSLMKKEEKDDIKRGISDSLLSRAFAKTEETWVLITDKYFITSNTSETAITPITKSIRENYTSFPIIPLSVLAAKNLYNESHNLEPVEDVKSNLDKIIANDLFGDEGGFFSKSSFSLTSGGGDYTVSNGDTGIPELIESVLEGDRVFKKANISNSVYHCTISGKDMHNMASLYVSNTEIPKDSGDMEEEWFNGTCTIYIDAFQHHIDNMACLCADA